MPGSADFLLTTPSTGAFDCGVVQIQLGLLYIGVSLAELWLSAC